MSKTEAPTVTQAIIAFLKDSGIENAFGVIGGPIANFVVGMMDDDAMNVFHCKHEGGAAFAALEASLASGKPQVLFVTTGPGLTNALTGILAARGEGAKVLVMSGTSPVKERGRFVSQDTSQHSFARALFGNDAIFDFSTTIEHAEELALALLRVQQGFSRPQGFVAHIGLSAVIQKTPVANASVPTRTFAKTGVSSETAKMCAEKLSSGPFAVWAGFGALGAWQEVRTLLEVTGAPLLCTPRAKGIVPESHPQYVGMTGLGSEEHVETFLARNAFEHVLVLGSRLGEASSFWTDSYSPRKGFIHVDLNPKAMSAAYLHVETLGVQAEIQGFLTALLAEWKYPKQSFYEGREREKSETLEFLSGPVRPSMLMKVVQREIVDGSDATICVDVGNAFSFSNRYLEFAQPNRYRVHFDFGAMGSAAAGVLGIAVGSGKKAVALVGDGAFLMHNEINTAVRYNLPCVWIVLNDARYGMVAQGMEAFYGVGGDKQSAFPECDFVQIARGMGADGIRVANEAELAAAIKRAMREPKPFVIDVIIDKNEQAPAQSRFKSLIRQGSAG